MSSATLVTPAIATEKTSSSSRVKVIGLLLTTMPLLKRNSK